MNHEDTKETMAEEKKIGKVLFRWEGSRNFGFSILDIGLGKD